MWRVGSLESLAMSPSYSLLGQRCASFLCSRQHSDCTVERSIKPNATRSCERFGVRRQRGRLQRFQVTPLTLCPLPQSLAPAPTTGLPPPNRRLPWALPLPPPPSAGTFLSPPSP